MENSSLIGKESVKNIFRYNCYENEWFVDVEKIGAENFFKKSLTFGGDSCIVCPAPTTGQLERAGGGEIITAASSAGQGSFQSTDFPWHRRTAAMRN